MKRSTRVASVPPNIASPIPIQLMRATLKRGELSLQPLLLNIVIEEVLRLIKADLIGRGITVSEQLSADLPAVKGDRVQLQQAVLNLVLNAAEAMAANEPGSRRRLITTMRCGDTARVSVRDQGPGLPEDVDPLFKPFLTTKDQGLGMGLAICRSIIAAHHGHLWAEAHPERGAVFQFELPVADSQANP